MDWDDNLGVVSSSGSDYGPEAYLADGSDDDESNQMESNSPTFPFARASPLWQGYPEEFPNVAEDEQTPWFVHFQGCECNGCNRLSPASGERASGPSYPVDAIMLSNRLKALIEKELLEIDIDQVHRAAEIEQREIITEFRFLQGMAEHREDELLDELIKSLESVGPTDYSSAQLDESSTIMGNNKDPATPHRASAEPLQDVDIDVIHALAEAEEEYIRSRHLEWAAGQDTIRMVSQCVLDRRIDKLEKIADEVIGVQPINGVIQDRPTEENYSLTKPP